MCGYPQNIGVGSMLIALTIAFFTHVAAAEFTVDSGVTAIRSLRGNAGVRIEAQLEDPGGIEIQPLENAVRVLLDGCQLSGKPGDPLLPFNCDDGGRQRSCWNPQAASYNYNSCSYAR